MKGRLESGSSRGTSSRTCSMLHHDDMSRAAQVAPRFAPDCRALHGLDCCQSCWASPADRGLDLWAVLGYDVKLYAQRWERRENVAEHDHAIWLEGFPGLQGKLYGNVGGFRSMAEAKAL